MRNRMFIYLIIGALLGGIAGSLTTLGVLQYKLKHDSGALVKEIIIEQKDVIIVELREEVEKELDQMINARKAEILGEVRKTMEDVIGEKKQNLNQEIEKAIDDYIKMKLKNIFSN
ncbi:putative secreted protein with C-terminal beta-propeller domain [Anaerosolibacter carboniphilus]|uniref:Putative secreted protein with C-terminal beta-propeller domain n=1 Tax=Anaerosolibacter carboniphilus TaxID=1417629 RepID=A0A841L4G0_9FIRM|nr:hypothetical protein [Anaerosolibacter carboniphilus]MBB6217215.1 putative secreted protein with C-terminal beta-propeller domain [Anaerosolibacter carboniphilus]